METRARAGTNPDLYEFSLESIELDFEVEPSISSASSSQQQNAASDTSRGSPPVNTAPESLLPPPASHAGLIDDLHAPVGANVGGGGPTAVSAVAPPLPDLEGMGLMTRNAAGTDGDDLGDRLRWRRWLGVFDEFERRNVEHEYRRYATHVPLYTGWVTYLVIGAASSSNLRVDDTDVRRDSVACAVTCALGTLLLLGADFVFFDRSTMNGSHKRASFIYAVEPAARMATGLCISLLVHVKSHECERPLTQTPDRCGEAFRAATIICLWFLFAFVPAPRDALIGALAIAFFEIASMSSIAEPRGAVVAYLCVCLFASIATLLASAIMSDRIRRRTFVSLASVAWADRELGRQKGRVAAVVRAALPSAVVTRLAGARSGLDISSFYDANTMGTVCITGATDFGAWASHRLQIVVIAALHHLFSIFDKATDVFGVDQATTFGDEYVVTSGLIRKRRSGGVGNAIRFALWQLAMRENSILQLRSAIAVGQLVAGLGGVQSLRYVVGGAALSGAVAVYQRTPAGSLHITREAQRALRSDPHEHFSEEVLFRELDASGVVGISFNAMPENSLGPGDFGEQPTSQSIDAVASEETLARIGNRFAVDPGAAAPPTGGGGEPPAARTAESREPHAITDEDAAEPSKAADQEDRFVLHWSTFRDPEDEAIFHQDAATLATRAAPWLTMAQTLWILLILIVYVNEARGDDDDTRTQRIVVAVLLGLSWVVSGTFSVWQFYVRRRGGNPAPHLAFVALIGVVNLVVLVSIGSFGRNHRTLISNDPFFLIVLQIPTMIYIVTRPWGYLPSIIYMCVTVLIPVATINIIVQGTEGAPTFLAIIVIFVATLVHAYHRKATDRTAFAIGKLAAERRNTAETAVQMLNTLVSQTVPAHVINVGIKMLERDEHERRSAGEFDLSRVGQLVAYREQYHQLGFVEAISDLVCVHVRLKASSRTALDPYTQSLQKNGLSTSTSDAVGGHLDAAMQVAALSRDGYAPGVPFAALLDALPTESERVAMQVLLLWSLLTDITARASNGTLEVVQALGDDAVIAGPLGSKSDEAAVQAAAYGAVMLVHSLHSELGISFTAVAALDEGAGAMLGRGTLRYRVFGDAVRQATAIVDAAPHGPGSSFGGATTSFVRRIAPMLVRGPVSASEQEMWADSPNASFFAAPQRWRVQHSGLVYVYPIVQAPSTTLDTQSTGSAQN